MKFDIFQHPTRAAHQGPKNKNLKGQANIGPLFLITDKIRFLEWNVVNISTMNF